MIFPPPNFTASDAWPVHRGLSTVVFGVQRGDGHFVCKRLSSRARTEDEAARSLAREGEILEALAGRGAPRLVARGEDGAGPYVVTERLAMQTLERLRPCRAIELAARSAFAALGAAHDAGVVHADVSPSNVLASSNGASAALVDFGLAIRIGAKRSDGAFRGTLAFAAPEAARGESIEVRSDLFSLAATVLAVVSGSPPRSAPHDAALLVLAGEQAIDSWASRAAEPLPKELGRALLACVSFDREARPASAREVLGRASRAC